MAHKTTIDGTGYTISGGKTLLEGTSYAISGGQTMIDGTKRSISFQIPVGQLPVNASVFFHVDGVAREFIVVNQGTPSVHGRGNYYVGANGTWLLQKEIYEDVAFDQTGRNYQQADIQSKLSNFQTRLDATVRNALMEVRVPFEKMFSGMLSLLKGNDGCVQKVFLLSEGELDTPQQSISTNGDSVSAFYQAANSARVAYKDGVPCRWWLRGAVNLSSKEATYVDTDGTFGRSQCILPMSTSLGFRPAFVLPFNFIVKEYLI